MSRVRRLSPIRIYLTEIYSAGDGSRTFMISYSLMGMRLNLDTFRLVVHPQHLQIIQTVELPVHRVTLKHATCRLNGMMQLLSADLTRLLSLLRNGAKLIWRSSSKPKVSSSIVRQQLLSTVHLNQAFTKRGSRQTTGGRTSCTSRKSG